MDNLTLLRKAEKEIRKISINHDLTTYEKKTQRLDGKMVRGMRAATKGNEPPVMSNKHTTTTLPSTIPRTH